MSDNNMSPINSNYIRNEYEWDYMADVKWDVIRNNLACARRVVSFPEMFPNADFEYLHNQIIEFELFLLTNGK